MYLGIDIGSSSSKVALIGEDKNLINTAFVNKGTGTDGVEKALNMLFEKTGTTMDQIKYTVVTGYGRVTYEKADNQITEISCHAKGISYLMDGVRTIIDIGGQDAKVIKIGNNGRVVNFVMNEKCAAGTGRFLEVMARVLGCNINDLAELSFKSQKEVSISSVCTVFAETEAISHLSLGEKIEDVAKGAHTAIAKRVAGMCARAGAEPKYAMSGGVALNSGMVDALSKELGHKVYVAPYSQIVGAVGAAVSAWETMHKEEVAV